MTYRHHNRTLRKMPDYLPPSEDGSEVHPVSLFPTKRARDYIPGKDPDAEEGRASPPAQEEPAGELPEQTEDIGF